MTLFLHDKYVSIIIFIKFMARKIYLFIYTKKKVADNSSPFFIIQKIKK
jgi:hypothetical protein